MKIQPTTSAPKRQPLWLVRAMTTLYCKHIHRGSQLCQQCSDLIAFETQRSEQCCRDSGTLSCRECLRQCYPDAKRLEINHIIRWAQPKARWRKPIWIARRYMGSLLN